MLVDGVKSYRFDLSLFFLVSFFTGIAFSRIMVARGKRSNCDRLPFIPGGVKLSLMGLALLYIYVVVVNGLEVRRQGSEDMAYLFANLPLMHLAILRIFEIIFYPFLFIILRGLQYDRAGPMKLLLAIFLVAFVFTGILDSRAKIILPLFYYYAVFIAPKSKWMPISNKFLIGMMVFAFSAIVVITFYRLNDFDGFFEYIREDILSRLDGLDFVSQVAGQVGISWWGTHDFLVFSNFIAAIPFLEEANALKEIGMTSSKNYLLQQVLGLAQFDVVNTLATDLYYFGGYFLLMIGAAIYGFLVMRFDIVARTNRLWSSRIMMAFMFSFLINALRIEIDFFGMVINILRDFSILYCILLTINFPVISASNSLHRPQ